MKTCTYCGREYDGKCSCDVGDGCVVVEYRVRFVIRCASESPDQIADDALCCLSDLHRDINGDDQPAVLLATRKER